MTNEKPFDKTTARLPGESLIEQIERLSPVRLSGQIPSPLAGAQRVPVPPPAPSPLKPVPQQIALSSFQLDGVRLAARGLISPQDRRSKITEEFRVIKRRLLRQLSGENEGAHGIVLVTSAHDEAGKSFIATNLALSFALDEQVETILVDTDNGPHPSPFDLPPAPGLIDVIEGMQVERALRRAEGLSLSVLPHGEPVASAVPLYQDQRTAQLLRDLERRAPIVILDAGSLLSSTEPLVLVSQVKHVVLVAEAERTTGQELDAAIALVDSPDRVSVVLNKASARLKDIMIGRPDTASGRVPPIALPFAAVHPLPPTG